MQLSTAPVAIQPKLSEEVHSHSMVTHRLTVHQVRSRYDDMLKNFGDLESKPSGSPRRKEHHVSVVTQHTVNEAVSVPTRSTRSDAENEVISHSL